MQSEFQNSQRFTFTLLLKTNKKRNEKKKMFYRKRSEKLGKLGKETHACHPSTKKDGKFDVSLGNIGRSNVRF